MADSQAFFSGATFQVQLNGEAHQTGAPTVAALLEELEIAPVGVAVAVNGQVVRRASHAEWKLNEGDQVEIIRAVQGG